MDPFLQRNSCNNMSRENMMEVMRIMQNQVQKKRTRYSFWKTGRKNWNLWTQCFQTVLRSAQRRRFGSSSEKYADGYEQMNLFNEAEAASDGEPDPEKEIEVTSHKRKKHAGKKEEDLRISK